MKKTKLIPGSINNVRIIQVSQTFDKGVKVQENILNIWEGEWIRVETAEKKIKNLKEERQNLGNGSWNTVKHMIVLNHELNKMIGA